MKTEGTIINVMLDAARGTVAVTSRESECGKPIGALPKPTRKGYDFAGWYLEDELVDESYVPESDEDITLVAHWTKRVGKKKMTSLRKQRIAVAVLLATALLLIGALVFVNYIVTIYPVVDQYQTEDGSIGEETYYLRKKNGVYGMYRKDGTAVEQNDDGYYLADSGNQYSIDPETGKCDLFAAVDYDPAKGELLNHIVNRVLMFGQIKQDDIYSIKVSNSYGDYRFYRNENGDMKIEGFEDSMIEYNGEVFADLCVSCGYTLSKEKLDMDSPSAPKNADGSIDLAAYGLADRYDETGKLISPATYTITKARYEDNKCYASETVYTVKVGDATPAKNGYYAMLEGRDNAIYVLDPMLENATLQPIEALVTPRVSYPMSLTTAMRIQNFSLIRFDTFLGTEKLEDGNPHPIVMFSYVDLDSRTNTFYTTVPYTSDIELMAGYAIHDDTVSDMIMKFYDMQIIRCVELGLTADKMQKYGLDKNVHWLYFESSTGKDSDAAYIKNAMVVSPKTEKGTYYVASYLYDMIVEVDQHYFSFLELEQRNWYEQYFISQNIAYVDYMKMEINGKTYEFKMDNSLTYTYYFAADGKPTLVNLTKGTLHKNKSDGRYGFQPHGENKVYEIHYVDFENGTFKPSSDQTIYMVGDKELILETDASNMFVYCEQYNNPKNPENPHLLDYQIVHTYVDDKGQTKAETIYAIDNFRRFWIQDWYWLSLEGDVDPDDFERLTGMTVEEYIKAKGNDCYASITVNVEDMAKNFNHYTYKDENGNTVKLYDENNQRYIIYRFYRYSERKAMVTVEIVKDFDENGNPISDPTNVVGRFYVLSSYLDMMGEDLEKIINEERVKRDD